MLENKDLHPEIKKHICNVNVPSFLQEINNRSQQRENTNYPLHHHPTWTSFRRTNQQDQLTQGSSRILAFGSAQLSTLSCDLWGNTVRGICHDTSWYVYSFGLLHLIYGSAEKKQIAFLLWLLFLLLTARAFLLALLKRFSSALQAEAGNLLSSWIKQSRR